MIVKASSKEPYDIRFVNEAHVSYCSREPHHEVTKISSISQLVSNTWTHSEIPVQARIVTSVAIHNVIAFTCIYLIVHMTFH